MLLGSNGAGKSTLIRTAAGLLPAIGGEVTIGEKLLTEYRDAERSRVLSVLLSENRPMERMSCREVVSLGRYPYTGRFGVLRKEDEAVVAEAMERVGVTALAERDYAKMSDGQRQRVRLARALAQEPEVLLLDEPTAFLDVSYQAEFLVLLKRQAKEKGIAVLLSLHEIELALSAADRILCIKDGGVYASGTPGEVCSEGKIRSLYGLDELGERIGDQPEIAAYVERIGRKV